MIRPVAGLAGPVTKLHTRGTMRILLVTSSMPWPTHGGVNQRTNLLYRSLSELGKVDTVLISRYGKTDKDKWQAIVKDFGGKQAFEERLTEHRVPMRWAGKLSPSLPHRLTHIFGYKEPYLPDNWNQTGVFVFDDK